MKNNQCEAWRPRHLSTLKAIHDRSRRQNSGRLQAKTGSNYHLPGSTDVKISEKSLLKIK